MAENNNADIKKMPFERAIDELESIVKRLEEGKVPVSYTHLTLPTILRV